MATRPIDEKIVAMKMDNSDFKQKALETTSLFGKLRDSLNKIPGVNLGKVSNDFKDIQRAANGTDLSGMAKAIDTISNRFSAMGVIGTTALVNLTNKAVNAGMALSNSLGMEQVNAGFREYELKIGSIGTVLSNTEWAGTGLKDVNKTFQDLNEYADKTIYNFAQMTQNIGRFTAAGVTLEDSATAIKGLGNLAAISGSNTEQLNTAMYQMSQALSSGKLNLMDWNSLINAGMGGKKTQDALLNTAKAMGVNVDMSEGFRNSISDGWLTSEIFLETLKQFGEDESMTEAATKVRTFSQMLDTLKEGIGSGWATTWELVFGDFQEATALWTALSNAVNGFFQKQADARNGLIRSLIDGDAIFNIITGIKNAATPIIQVFKAIGSGFRVAFPPMGVSGLEKLLDGFRNLTSGMAFSADNVERIKTIFAGFFSILAMGWDVIKAIGGVILALIPSFSGLGSKLLELVSRIAEIPIAFRGAKDASDELGSGMTILQSIASGVATALEFIIDGILNFTEVVAGAWNILTKGDFSNGPWAEGSIAVTWLLAMREGFIKFGDAVGGINLESISSAFTSFFDSLRNGYQWVSDKLVGIGETIKNAMPSGNELLAGGFIAGLVAMFGAAIKLAWDFLQVFTGWGKIGAGISETLEGLGSALESFALQAKANILLAVAIALGILAGSLFLLSKLKWKDIAPGLYAMAGGLAAVVGALFAISKMDVAGLGMGPVLQIIAIGTAFSIMAIGLRTLSGINWNEMAVGITGAVVLLGALSGAIILMSKFSGDRMLGVSALQFLAIAASMHILVSAIEKMTNIEVGTLTKGVATIGAILLAMGGFLYLTEKSKFGVSSAVGIAAIAGAIWLMTIPIKQLGELKTDNIQQALETIGMLLVTIAAFSLITSDAGLLATGAGLALLAGALTLLLVPITAMGNMDLLALTQGLVAMGVALAAIGAASMLMTGMAASGAGLILVAVALNMLLIPITALSIMPLGALATGIIALSAGILLIGGAAALLGLAAPWLLAGSIGIAALGVAMLAAGAGISLFGAGLTTLAALTGTAIMAIIASIGTLIAGLVSLIPTFVSFMYELGTKVLDAIIEYSPIIINKLYDLAIAIINVFTERAPQFASAATALIVAFLNVMGTNIPRIVTAAAQLMVALITSLADTVATEGHQFLDAFSRLMAEVSIIMVDAGLLAIKALFGWIPGVTDAANAIGEVAETRIRETFDAAGAANDKGTEFSSTLEGTSGQAKVAGESLASSSEAGASSADLHTIADGHGSDYSGGLMGQIGNVNTAGVDLANSGKDGAASVDMSPTGEDFTMGFASGISSGGVLEKVKSAASTIASAAWTATRKFLDVRSPSRKMYTVGEYTGEGYSLGVESTEGTVKKSANSLAGVIMNIFGIKGEPVKEAKKGGTAAGNAYSSGVKSTDKKVTKAGKSTGSSYNKGLKSTKKDTAKTAKDIANDASKAFNEAMEKQQHELKMGRIDSTKYISEIEKLKRAYSKYPELVRKAESEIKKAQDDAAKHKEELRKKEHDAQKKAISDRKYYNEMSLTQELKAWEDIQKKYKKGSEEREEADKEVYRIKNDINKKLLEINEEYTSKIEEANQRLIDSEKELNQEYEDALNARTAKLTDYVGLFDEVNKNVEVSGWQLMENLRGQIATFREWSDNLKELGGKGIDSNLLAELREMGPSAAGEIAALNTLTREELIEYSSLWKHKNLIARDEATTELEGMKADTAVKITELRTQTSEQLTTYKAEWVNKIKEIRTGVTGEYVRLNDDMKEVGKNTIRGLMNGLTNMTPALMAQAQAIAAAIRATIQSALDINSPSRVMTQIGEWVGEGLVIGMDNSIPDVVSSSKSLAMAAKDSLDEFINGFEIPDGDNEIHFKAVIDYDKMDLNKVKMDTLSLIPDTSYTLRSANAIRKSPVNDSSRNQGNTTHDNSRNFNPVTYIQAGAGAKEIARENERAMRNLAYMYGG